LFGFEFRGRDSDNKMEIIKDGKEINYILLNVIEFTSSRKRMSVIV
jgi:magnesium-transporting ATPase (P-type)